MENLQINDFKAFTNLTIDCGAEKRNILVYGDNGSGKTSVYEGIKIAFYYNRLLNEYIRPGRTPEQRASDEAEFKNKYKNKRNGRDFAISINGSVFTACDFSKYQCFMISNKDLKAQDNKIVFKKVIGSVFFPSFNVDDFVNDNSEIIKSRVNNTLHTVFMTLELSIDFEGDDRIVKLIDATHGLSASDGLSYEFNEAKINLVSLLLLLTSVQILKNGDASTHRLLVMDDVVSSLDSAYRIFLTNYLFDNFNDFQKIILTHNVSYFNLMHFRLKSIDNTLDANWREYNLYETEVGHYGYCYSMFRTPGMIKDDVTNNRITLSEAGNEIRKYFEATIYEYAKLVMVGTFEESGQVLKKLLDKNALYMKKGQDKMLYSSDLLITLDSISADAAKTDTVKVQEISSAIATFKHDTDVNKIADILKELKMFQKVVMHQASHGTGTLPTMSINEILSSLSLLDKLKSVIKNFKDDNAYGAV